MAKVYSFSVPDDEVQLIAILDELKSRKMLSHEIVKLLKTFYLGRDHNTELISKEMLMLLEIKKKLEEYEKWRQEILLKLTELEEKLKQKQEEKQTEDDLSHIRILREVHFDDIDKIRESINNGADLIDLSRQIKARLNGFATERGLSYPDAKRIFFKAFPDLKDKLEGLL